MFDYIKLNKVFFILLIISTCFAFIELCHLPFWWDEGWNTAVAKNWVVSNHFGRISNHILLPPGLNGSITVILPVAVFFKLFGVDTLQARLPGLLFTISFLISFYSLTKCLWNKGIAICSFLVLMFLSGNEHIHPLILGIQVLGEMPMMLFIIVGYLLLIKSFQQPLLFCALASLSFALALQTKVQAQPFVLLALILPALTGWLYQQKKIALVFTSIALGTIISNLFLNLFFSFTSKDRLGLENLYLVTAWVTNLDVRIEALKFAVLHGLPVIIALTIYGTFLIKIFKDKIITFSINEMVKFSLYLLITSWFAWALFCSIGWARYFSLPFLFATPFIADLIMGLTDFSMKNFLNSCINFFFKFEFNKKNVANALLLIIGIYTITTSISYVTQLNINYSIKDTIKAADYLNSRMAETQLVETYDSELFMFLDVPYHFPNDEIHVKKLGEYMLNWEAERNYKNIIKQIKPDFIVVSDFTISQYLYAPFLKENSSYILEKKIGTYRIYSTL